MLHPNDLFLFADGSARCLAKRAVELALGFDAMLRFGPQMLPEHLETVIVQAVAAGVACFAEDLQADQWQALEAPYFNRLIILILTGLILIVTLI